MTWQRSECMLWDTGRRDLTKAINIHSRHQPSVVIRDYRSAVEIVPLLWRSVIRWWNHTLVDTGMTWDTHPDPQKSLEPRLHPFATAIGWALLCSCSLFEKTHDLEFLLSNSLSFAYDLETAVQVIAFTPSRSWEVTCGFRFSHPRLPKICTTISEAWMHTLCFRKWSWKRGT